MTLEEHIYLILLTQGPCTLEQLYEVIDIDQGNVFISVDVLMRKGITIWVDDPEGRLGNIFIGLNQ